MLKIQASCFFLLGSDRERQSLHLDLLRRIQHKSAPSAALPAAARPGGDRWRIVPAFLHRASAGCGSDRPTARPGPGTFLCWGKGSDEAGEGRAALGRGAGLARRVGRGRVTCAAAAFSCPTALRWAPPSRRQPQNTASSDCPGSQAAAGAPEPNPTSDPPTWPPLQSTPSALLLLPQRQRRFPARAPRLLPARRWRRRVSQGRGELLKRCCSQDRSPRCPPIGPLSFGRLRVFNTSYSTGEPRIIFTADLQGRRPEAARAPFASPRREIFVVQPGGAKRGGRPERGRPATPRGPERLSSRVSATGRC